LAEREDKKKGRHKSEQSRKALAIANRTRHRKAHGEDERKKRDPKQMRVQKEIDKKPFREKKLVKKSTIWRTR